LSDQQKREKEATRAYERWLYRKVCNVDLCRDVPDIRFQFRLAGYPAIFGYPVPVPVPAKILAIAGYCSWIIYLFNGAKKRYYYKYNNSF